MIRGTTPTLEFVLPSEIPSFKTLWITFAQNNIEIFTVKKDQCEIEGNIIRVTLDQDQTLNLSASTFLEMQIRGLTVNDESVASNIIKTQVQRILKDGVIT